ncbi:uncharacterized protein LOC62_01G001706 [Vanrija pseudolonga]|uniref:Uncharacterized protein n=1 Tax=Vanrija pseudolonga TaxID=143232 RepID=A0AAF0Y5I6_9TREE|nr:hypothetical protein LOC62_01G001706 [Vanrija pseudolonga]
MILTTLLRLSCAILAAASAIRHDAKDVVELEARTDPLAIWFDEYGAYQCGDLYISWTGGKPGFRVTAGAWDLTPGSKYPFVLQENMYPVFFREYRWRVEYAAGSHIFVAIYETDTQGHWNENATVVRNATVQGPHGTECVLRPTHYDVPSQSSTQSPSQTSDPSHTPSPSDTSSPSYTSIHSTSTIAPPSKSKHSKKPKKTKT